MKTYKDFKYKIINNEVAIIDYIGNETNVIIPFKIKGYSVTSIWEWAFECCSSLTSVSIPNSVNSIEYNAFEGCCSLTQINVDENNTQYSSKDGVLFNKDKTTLIQYPAGKTNTSYEIPNSVTSIGKLAFCYCSSLTSVSIPNSVTRIGSCAFEYCTSLTDITIPNSVTSIEYNAFKWCSSLTSTANNYKAFDIENNKLICMKNCEFKENEWSDNIDNPKLCKRGYHFCTNLFEVFNYYSGKLDEDIAIYECEVGDIVIESKTSKRVTNKIKPVKRLSREDVIRILNGIN